MGIRCCRATSPPKAVAPTCAANRRSTSRRSPATTRRTRGRHVFGRRHAQHRGDRREHDLRQQYRAVSSRASPSFRPKADLQQHDHRQPRDRDESAGARCSASDAHGKPRGLRAIRATAPGRATGDLPDRRIPLVTGSHNLVGQLAARRCRRHVFSHALGLGPLAYNGGPTRTHAVLRAARSSMRGNNLLDRSFDQRGAPFARVRGAAPDIGAFER